MAIATKEQLLKVLRAFNPWWTSGVVPSSFTKEYRRFAYYEAMKRLDQKDIRRTVVLTGTRRVGKTTIEYQMIDALLKKGIAPSLSSAELPEKAGSNMSAGGRQYTSLPCSAASDAVISEPLFPLASNTAVTRPRAERMRLRLGKLPA